ncbi:uncharacterized protein HMPREF1541_02271 [Cyphellophora europaea CBS 101466]|uniref:Uncharacterized protein n=1 Tax=Cyphellophora europaea (strain CBS 101466) TaxID=1220924 RepID=W2S4Z1_CYPE1|nr:uncharacterized protein HMPREF1541_02271 [Cyphellophora europaea CBS 101466]ETN43113.1 hypothetical protein HMPREF1541_02271 [Cyphellophora europaea CBS 101466]
MAAGDTQNDFARSMAEKLKYLNQEIIDKYPPDEPVSIINLIVPSPGKEAEAQAAMAEYCTAVVEKKAGCIQFQLSKAVRFPDGAFQFVHHEK